jgi:hypothetical protein
MNLALRANALMPPMVLHALQWALGSTGMLPLLILCGTETF